MANTPPITPANDPYNFEIFSQDQVFRGKEVQKMFEKMLSTAEDIKDDEIVRNEFNRKRNIMLKEGVNLLVDEVKVKKRILDVDLQDKGALQGVLAVAKNTLEHAKETYRYHNLTGDRRKELKILEEKLSDMKKQDGGRNKEFEKHLAKTIRDEQFSIKLQEMKGQAMINAHPLGPRMGAFLSSSAGQTTMKAASMLGGIFVKIFDGLMWLVKGVFSAITRSFTDSWKLWLQIQAITGNIAADMGQTEFQTQQINNNVGRIGIAAAQWGVNIEDALSFMTQFSQATGLNHIFLKEQIGDLSAIAKATGLGVQGTGEMYAQMELLGFSTGQFRTYVEETRDQAGMMGLNITKILTTVKTLLPAYNALNFKEGVKGLTAMVMKAQSLRFELDNMRNLAVQVFNPEGAVELAAKLRVLGGSFAKMADPFNLMLKGQTDAAGLMDDVMNTMAGIAIKGKDGMFSIPPVQQALLREFAAATGENVDNLTRTTLQMAKQQDIIGRLQSRGMFKPEDLTAVANMAEWDEKRGEYMIKVDVAGTKKAISEINANLNIAKQMHGFVREEQQVATTRMNLIEQLRNMYNMFLFSLQPIFRPIEALFKDSRFMAQLQKTMSDLGNFIASKIEPLFNSGGGVYNWMYKLGEGLKNVVMQITDILSGGGNLFTVLGKATVFLITETWKVIQPAIKDLLMPMKEKIQSGAGMAGALGGAVALGGAGAQIGFISGGPLGMAIGGGIGAIIGGIAGYFTGKSAVGGVLSDAIVRSDGSVQPFSKGDLAMLIDEKSLKGKTDMIPSKSLMSQVPMYPKEKYAPLNTYQGGSNNTTQKITLDITGTLKIEGEKESVYLTSADLKNIGLQKLAYVLANEQSRLDNNFSSKRNSKEIVSAL